MRWRRQTSETGESLIELTVAVAILGLAVVAILGGMTTAISVSALHRDQAAVSTVMTAAAEHVKEVPYKKCAVMSDYLASFTYPPYSVTTDPPNAVTVAKASTPTWKVTFAIADWTGDGFTRPSSSGDTTCVTHHNEGLRTQLITITAITADGKVRQAIPIVKRFRNCPPPAPATPGCDVA